MAVPTKINENVVRPCTLDPKAGFTSGLTDMAHGGPILRGVNVVAGLVIGDPAGLPYSPSIATARLVTVLSLPQWIGNTANAWERYKVADATHNKEGRWRAVADGVRGVFMTFNAALVSAASSLQVARYWIWNGLTRRINNGLGTAVSGLMIFNNLFVAYRRATQLWRIHCIRSELAQYKTPEEKFNHLRRYLDLQDLNIDSKTYAQIESDIIEERIKSGKGFERWVVGAEGKLNAETLKNPEIHHAVVQRHLEAVKKQREADLMLAMGSEIADFTALMNRIKPQTEIDPRTGKESTIKVTAQAKMAAVTDLEDALVKNRNRCAALLFSAILGFAGHVINICILAGLAVCPWAAPILLLVVATINSWDDTRIWLRQLEIGEKVLDRPFSKLSVLMNFGTFIGGLAFKSGLTEYLVSIVLFGFWAAANTYTLCRMWDKEDDKREEVFNANSIKANSEAMAKECLAYRKNPSTPEIRNQGTFKDRYARRSRAVEPESRSRTTRENAYRKRKVKRREERVARADRARARLSRAL